MVLSAVEDKSVNGHQEHRDFLFSHVMCSGQVGPSTSKKKKKCVLFKHNELNGHMILLSAVTTAFLANLATGMCCITSNK